jgi:uncharacterized protein (TIGR02996 family)
MTNSLSSTDDAFVRGVLEDPTDDACLAFSDWLEEHGDLARAELVRVQCELARWVPDLAERTALQERERTLIAEHAREWLGPLHDLCEEFHFERGLAHLSLSARRFVGRAFAANEARWLRRALACRVCLKDLRKHLTSAARSPHLGSITALDIGGNDLDDVDLQTLLASPER